MINDGDFVFRTAKKKKRKQTNSSGKNWREIEKKTPAQNFAQHSTAIQYNTIKIQMLQLFRFFSEQRIRSLLYQMAKRNGSNAIDVYLYVHKIKILCFSSSLALSILHRFWVCSIVHLFIRINYMRIPKSCFIRFYASHPAFNKIDR